MTTDELAADLVAVPIKVVVDSRDTPEHPYYVEIASLLLHVILAAAAHAVREDARRAEVQAALGGALAKGMDAETSRTVTERLHAYESVAPSLARRDEFLRSIATTLAARARELKPDAEPAHVDGSTAQVIEVAERNIDRVIEAVTAHLARG